MLGPDRRERPGYIVLIQILNWHPPELRQHMMHKRRHPAAGFAVVLEPRPPRLEALGNYRRQRRPQLRRLAPLALARLDRVLPAARHLAPLLGQLAGTSKPRDATPHDGHCGASRAVTTVATSSASPIRWIATGPPTASGQPSNPADPRPSPASRVLDAAFRRRRERARDGNRRGVGQHRRRPDDRGSCKSHRERQAEGNRIKGQRRRRPSRPASMRLAPGHACDLPGTN